MKLSNMQLLCAASISSIEHDHHDHTQKQKQKLSITTLHMESNNAGVNFVFSRVEDGVTVAELMMDYPGHFVSCPAPVPRHAHPDDNRSSAELELNGKICALPADVELQRENLYLVMPMCKLNGRFSAEEKAALHCHVMSKCNTSHITPKTSFKKVAMALAQALKPPSPTKVSPLLTCTLPPPRVVNYKDEVVKYGLRLMPNHINNHPHSPSPSPSPIVENSVIEKDINAMEERPNLSMGLVGQLQVCSKPWTPKLDTIHEAQSL